MLKSNKFRQIWSEKKTQRVNQLKAKGQSLRDIGKELGISHMKVKRMLQIVTEA